MKLVFKTPSGPVETQGEFTKRYKVVMKPNELDLDDSITSYLDGKDGMIMVEVEDGNFKILNEEI